MLSKEDSRRLAQLERQLRRDDPEFCARMTTDRPARRRHVPLTLVFVALAVWIGALVLGVLGWWLAAAIAAFCATLIVIIIGYRSRPARHGLDPGPLPPVW